MPRSFCHVLYFYILNDTFHKMFKKNSTERLTFKNYKTFIQKFSLLAVCTYCLTEI